MECLQRQLVSAEDVAREIRYGQRRWTFNLRGALRDFGAGVVSAPEAEAHDIFTDAGLTSFIWNADLFTSTGVFIARPDGYDPDTGLALEIESRQHHSDDVNLERTLQRNARLAEHGIVVYGVSPAQLRAHPAYVVRQIKAAQAALRLRPPPRVTVRSHDGQLVRVA